MTKKKRRLIFGACFALILVGWVFLNPPGRLGFCMFGLQLTAAFHTRHQISKFVAMARLAV